MTVRIGTRASKLALTQTQQTADQLAAVGGFPVELVHIRTDGDVLTGSLSQMGGTGVFVAALRDALLRDQCDVAVHSLKDLPDGSAPWPEPRGHAETRRRPGRPVRPRRAQARRPARRAPRVGTGSPRRAAQLRAVRPDLDIRGHPRQRGHPPGPRPRAAGQRDRRRGGRQVLRPRRRRARRRRAAPHQPARRRQRIPRDGRDASGRRARGRWPSNAAPPMRTAEARIHRGLPRACWRRPSRPWTITDTRLAVTAERALLARLEAGCAAPVGAYAYRKGSMLYLEAVVCAVDGKALGPRQAGHGRPHRSGRHAAGHRAGRGPAGRAAPPTSRTWPRPEPADPGTSWDGTATATTRTGQPGLRVPEGARVLVTRSPDRAAALVAALRGSRRRTACSCRSSTSNTPATSTPSTSPSTPSAPGAYSWLVISSVTTVQALEAKPRERGVTLEPVAARQRPRGHDRPGDPPRTGSPGHPRRPGPAGQQSGTGLLDIWPAGPGQRVPAAGGHCRPAAAEGPRGPRRRVQAVTAYHTVDYPADPRRALPQLAGRAAGLDQGAVRRAGRACAVLTPAEAKAEIAAGRLHAVVAASPSAAPPHPRGPRPAGQLPVRRHRALDGGRGGVPRTHGRRRRRRIRPRPAWLPPSSGRLGHQHHSAPHPSAAETSAKDNHMSFPTHRPRRLRTTPAMRRLTAEHRLAASELILPAFIREGLTEPNPIASMPGVHAAHHRFAQAGRGRGRAAGRRRHHALRHPRRPGRHAAPLPWTPTAC